MGTCLILRSVRHTIPDALTCDESVRQENTRNFIGAYLADVGLQVGQGAQGIQCLLQPLQV